MGEDPPQEAIGSSPRCHPPQTLLLSHGAQVSTDRTKARGSRVSRLYTWLERGKGTLSDAFLVAGGIRGSRRLPGPWISGL
jgi:hypothetical protein